jgi:hypothetical protein
MHPLRPFDSVPEAGTTLRVTGGGTPFHPSRVGEAGAELRMIGPVVVVVVLAVGNRCIRCGPSTPCPKRALRSGRTVAPIKIGNGKQVSSR